MLTDEPPAIYLKRRCLAKDYFQQIPDERVGLNGWVRGTEAQCAQHRTSIGLDALRCQTVACLGGWLMTMPEYREWVAQLKRPSGQFLSNLRMYLGLSDTPTYGETRVFNGRCTLNDGPDARNPAVTDKTLALRRLDRLIAEAATTGMI